MDILMCRLCLRDSENVTNIFSFNERNSNIAEVLQQHFWFELTPNDKISTVICNTCWMQVSEFHQFYMSIEEAQQRYSEVKPLLKDDKIEPTNAKTQWLEEILLPTTSVADTLEKNTNIENPLEAELIESVEEALKKEPEGDEESIELPHTKVDSVSHSLDEEEYKFENMVATEMENNSSSSSSEDDSDIVVTRNSRIRRKATKTIIKSNVKKKKKLPKLRKYAPFCQEDEELIKKYITMACDLCLYLADNFDSLREHFKETHSGVRPFVKCCTRKLGKRCLLVEHARRHENPDYIKCEVCGKVFSNSSVLRAHFLMHHVPADECEFKCSECDKRFSRAHHLELHKATHVPVEDRKYVCTLCPKHNAFATESSLQVHISTQHRRAPNICHVCGKEIRDKAVFEKHVRLHFEDSGPRVKCPRPNCDRWLKDEDNLKAHLRRHNDEGKEFLCQECGKNCKNRRALVSHVRYSHSNTVFTCEQCNKTFKKDISLKEHMAQHTGEPLYKCPFCPRTFNSNANMHSHKKKMHPIEWDNWRKTKRGSAQAVLPSAQMAQTFRTQFDVANQKQM